MRTTRSWRVRNRAQAILLSADGYSVNAIADITRVDRDTVSIWIKNWEASGIAGLADKPITGRPRILTDEEQERALELIAKDPRNLKRVVDHLREQTGKQVSVDTLKAIGKKAGKVWKRVRKRPASTPDPEEVDDCKAQLEDLQEKADDGELDLYYGDASGFSLDPVVPYAWQDRGTTIEVPAAHSARLNTVGFLTRDVKVQAYEFQGSITSHVLIGCFEAFRATLTKTTVVVLDQAPIHTSEEFQDYAEEVRPLGLILFFLPAYCPELNLIEILWRKIKYEWLPFSAYDSLKALKDALTEIFQGLGSKYQIGFS